MQIIQKTRFPYTVAYAAIILFTHAFAFSAEVSTPSQAAAEATRYVSIPTSENFGVSFEWHSDMTIEQLKNQYAQFMNLNPDELIVSEKPFVFTDNNSVPQKISESTLIPLEKTHYAQEKKPYAYFIIQSKNSQPTTEPASTPSQQPRRTTYLEKGKKALQWIKDNPKIVTGAVAAIGAGGAVLVQKNTRELGSESKNNILDHSQTLRTTHEEKKEDILPPYIEKTEQLPAYEDFSQDRLPTYEELYNNK